jgi:hypothetical protein
MHQSPDGLWMDPDQIRAQVHEALDHEQATHALERSLTNAWRQCLHGVNPEVIEQRATETQAFVTAYIKATPGILDAVLASAKAVGTYEAVERVLRFTDSYFRQAVELIPDHLGLLGLLDDAYVAQRLLQNIADRNQVPTGRQLLSLDLTPANAAVRVLIGNPTVTHLDKAIADVLNSPAASDLFERIAQLGNRPPITITASYPKFSIDDGDQICLGMHGGMR